MASGDVSNRVRHGENSQAERQGDTCKSDADPRESCCQHGRSTSTKNQPKCYKEFRHRTLTHGHGTLLRLNCEMRRHAARVARGPKRSKTPIDLALRSFDSLAQFFSDVHDDIGCPRLLDFRSMGIPFASTGDPWIADEAVVTNAFAARRSRLSVLSEEC